MTTRATSVVKRTGRSKSGFSPTTRAASVVGRTWQIGLSPTAAQPLGAAQAGLGLEARSAQTWPAQATGMLHVSPKATARHQHSPCLQRRSSFMLHFQRAGQAAGVPGESWAAPRWTSQVGITTRATCVVKRKGLRPLTNSVCS